MIKITADSFMGIIYTLVLAIIIAIFVGVTINTFYPNPNYPESDVYKNVELEDREPTKEEIIEDEKQMREYDKRMQEWSQLTSIIALSAATLLVAIGLFIGSKIPIIPNGVLLGGLFTLFYGVILGFRSDSRFVTFGVTTAALFIVIGAGYMKFVRPMSK